MNPPTNELRAMVFEVAAGIRYQTDEVADTRLAELIALINEQLQLEVERNPPNDGDDVKVLVATCDAWASLVSHALAQAHAPLSPFPRNLAGWGQRAIQRVQQFAGTLQIPLSAAQQGLRASSYSISVGFPWGISIGFTWP
jgi:hypothetical protein